MLDIHDFISDSTAPTDTRAVSPVIGVILLVAITVILAAVVGTFVLGLSSEVAPASPNTNIAASYTNLNDGTADNDELTLTHDGGDPLTADTITVKVAATTVYRSGAIQSVTGLDTGATNQWTGDITAADTLVIAEDGSGTDVFGAGDRLRVVWNSPESGDTSILADRTVN